MYPAVFARRRFLRSSAHKARCILWAGACLLITGCGGGGSSSGGGGGSPATYTLIDLGTLPGGQTTYAEAINDAGQIVGQAQVISAGSSSFHAFLSTGRTLTDLRTLPGDMFSDARAISSTGRAAGVSETVSGIFRAFIVTAGKLTALGTLSGTNESFAQGINASGHVVGNAVDPAGNQHAFVYASGKMSDLGTLGGPIGEANAINDADQIVGDAETASNVLHAVAFHIGSATPTDLGTLPGDTRSSAAGINTRGQVVGYSVRPGTLGIGTVQQAFVFSSGKMTGLGKLSGDTHSTATAISGNGQIVGSSSGMTVSSALTFRAVLFHIGSTIPTDLNGQLSAADHAKWTLTEATGINDKGQICGNGTINGQSHAFLLTPAS